MIVIKPEQEDQLKKSALEATKAMTKGDVSAEMSRTVGVSYEFDRLHSVEDVSYNALSCRLFENDKAGVAFVNNPGDWEKMISSAKEVVGFGKKANFDLPRGEVPRPLSWKYPAKNMAYTKNDLKDIGDALLAQLKKLASSAKITVNVSNGSQYSFLANTHGLQSEDRSAWIGISGGVFEVGSDGSFIEIYEGKNYFEQDVDIDDITRPIMEQLEWSRRGATLSPGNYPVIFAPSALGIVVDPLLSAMNGKTLNKGLSVLKGKQNEKIVSSMVSLYDDPLRKNGYSFSVDDEGTVAARLSLIDKGFFKNFIFDCAEANIFGTKSTGHATRGAGSLPRPSFSNVCMELGSSSRDELFNYTDTAVLLCEGLGEGQSNVLAGDFSVLGSSAFLIKNGKIVGRIKDMMFSGNAYETLSNVKAIGNTSFQEGNMFLPYVLVDQVSISSGK
ncbi:MAG: TldD/PmbA family protein [Brevinema sp.]